MESYLYSIMLAGLLKIRYGRQDSPMPPKHGVLVVNAFNVVALCSDGHQASTKFG